MLRRRAPSERSMYGMVAPIEAALVTLCAAAREWHTGTPVPRSHASTGRSAAARARPGFCCFGHCVFVAPSPIRPRCVAGGRCRWLRRCALRSRRSHSLRLPAVSSMLSQARFCATRSRSSRMRTGIMSCRHAPAPTPALALRSLHLTLGPPLRCACAELTIALSAYWALGTGVTAERSPLRAEPLGS